MFAYLDHSLDEYNIFADVDSPSLFHDISPFDSPAYTKFSGGIQTVPDRAFSPLDTSSNSSCFDTSITSARRRSWKSFCRTLPANLPIPRPPTPSICSGSDQDADGESDDAGSDDEYIPPPDLDVQTSQNLKRRRSPLSRRAETSTRPLLSKSTHSSHNTTKHVRVAPPPRNKQASKATSLIISRVVNSNVVEQTKFICPECGWKQLNKRVPDFKRHLKTHLRSKDDDHSSGYWCKGVRVEDATQYGIQPDATPYRFLDHERIGGCMRTFSRRDALKRHLDNVNISCIG